MEKGDFLEVDCWPGFDRIAVIPPLTYEQDIEHVLHAFQMLKPGGRLVAVMSEEALCRMNRKIDGNAQFGTRLCWTSPAFHRMDPEASGFPDWLKEVGGEIEELPDELFLKGDHLTAVKARIVVIDKSQELPAGASAAMKEREVAPVTTAGA